MQGLLHQSLSTPLSSCTHLPLYQTVKSTLEACASLPLGFARTVPSALCSCLCCESDCRPVLAALGSRRPGGGLRDSSCPWGYARVK